MSVDSTPSNTYRLYRFEAANLVVTAEWIVAASDEEAIAKAEAACVDSKCELWDGDRLVAQIEPERQQA
jgi:hypothetical protein